MTAPTKPAVAQAVTTEAPAKESIVERIIAKAETAQERAAMFRQLGQRERSRQVRQAATLISEQTTWGKPLSVEARAAVALYALQCGTDPVRHWIVLGNKLYDTAELWLDLATSHPDFHYIEEPEYINDDPRLSDADKEERRQKRAKHMVPEDVKGACIARIHTRDGTVHQGVNWAGNRKCFVATQKAEGIKQDPIGEQDPGKTAFTRALRKAAKTAWPIWRVIGPPSDDEGLDLKHMKGGVDDVLQQGREAVKAGERASANDGKPLTAPSDPYAGPTVVSLEDEQRIRAQDMKLVGE